MALASCNIYSIKKENTSEFEVILQNYQQGKFRIILKISQWTHIKFHLSMYFIYIYTYK